MLLYLSLFLLFYTFYTHHQTTAMAQLGVTATALTVQVDCRPTPWQRRMLPKQSSKQADTTFEGFPSLSVAEVFGEARSSRTKAATRAPTTKPPVSNDLHNEAQEALGKTSDWPASMPKGPSMSASGPLIGRGLSRSGHTKF